MEQLEPRALLTGLLNTLLVRQPTALDDAATGEVCGLPASETSLTAWDRFYVELWVRAVSQYGEAVGAANVDLAFDGAYFEATEITYGPGFDTQHSGWLDQGYVWSVGAAATRLDVGDEGFALLARIQFEPVQTDPLLVRDPERFVGPFNLGLQVLRADGLTVGGVAPKTEKIPFAVEEVPQAEIWAVQADLDGNGAIDFGDLSYFAAALGQTAEPSSPFMVWASDLDHSGVVDLQDLGTWLAPSFGCVRGGRQRLELPPEATDVWRPPIHAHLFHDTAPQGGSNHDGITSETLIVGRLASELVSQVVLVVEVDGGLPSPLPFEPDGRFLYDSTWSDGPHLVRFTAMTESKVNYSCEVAFTLDRLPPPPPEFDIFPPEKLSEADTKTTRERVDLLGYTEPNTLVQIAGTRATAMSDETGQFFFTGVPLAVGTTPMAILAMDRAGNQSAAGKPLTRTFQGQACSPGMFLKISGIAGESTDGKHKDWIDVLSYSHGLRRVGATAAAAGARTSPRCQHEDFSIVHTLDKASPTLALYCCAGTPIDQVTLELGTPSGYRLMQYVLSDVVVTSVTTEGNTADGLITETVTFDYGKIEWTYTELDPATGEPEGEVSARWDLVSGREEAVASKGGVSSASAAADVTKSKAFDAYLKIDGVPGESTDDKHKDWLDVLSYSHGVSQPAGGAQSGAGRTAGRCEHKDFQIVHTLDKASPKLAQACSNGGHVREVRLELWKPTAAGPVKFMEYILSDVIVSSIHTEGSAQSDDRPVEEVSFNYGKIEWVYTVVDPRTGDPGEEIREGWNLTRDRRVKGADAVLTLAAEDAPSDLWHSEDAAADMATWAALQKALDCKAFDAFVKIDGVPGESTDDKHKDWIEIVSYSHGVSQPARVASSGGRTAQPCTHEDFRIVHTLDKASPTLALYCCNGKHVRSVVVQLTRPQDGKTYMQYKLTDVLVTSVRPSWSAGDVLPLEEVSFNYGKIEWTYTVFAPNGSTTDVTAQWDMVRSRGAKATDSSDAAAVSESLAYEAYAAEGWEMLQKALASKAVDAFLKIDGVPGESTDDKHKDWIEVLAYSHGVSQPSAGSRASGGARTSQRSCHEDFTVTHILDKASPTLALLCSSGRHVRTVTLELWKSSAAGPVRFMTYKLTDVLVTGVHTEGQAQGAEPRPLEDLSFSYGKIEWTYTTYDAHGGATGNVRTSWDLTADRAGKSAPEVSEPAVAAAEAPADLCQTQYAALDLQALLAGTKAYDMFLKIDGIPGESRDDKHKDWIEIISFSHAVSQPSAGSRSSGGAPSSGRCSHEDFSIVHTLDKASPTLALYCCKGQYIPAVTVQLVRADRQTYMEYKLIDVLVTSVRSGGSVRETLPIEQVSFNYGKIEWTYTTYNASGTRTGQVKTSWDLDADPGGKTADSPATASPTPDAPAELYSQAWVLESWKALADTKAYDAFLKIEGVPGESTDAKHKDWIDVLSYSHGVSQPTAGSHTSGSARATGRCHHEDFSIVHRLDKASPKLYLYCCNGQRIPTVTLELWRAGATQQKFMTYKLSDVLVTSVYTTSTEEGCIPPYEEVSFSYGKIEWTYTWYDPGTGQPSVVEAHWDVARDRGGKDSLGAGQNALPPASAITTVSAASKAGAVTVRLVAVAAPTPEDQLETLPGCLSEVGVGASFWVEAWVQDASDPPVGITGGWIDLEYTAGAFGVAGTPGCGGQLPLFPSGSADASPTEIVDLGAGTLAAGIGGPPTWTKLGSAEFFATRVGAAAFQALPGSLPFAGFGAGNVDWLDVELGGLVLTALPSFEPLGPLTFLELPAQDPSGGDRWYQLQTTHGGFLTIEAVCSSDPNAVQLDLYSDPLGDPLVTSAVVAGRPRIDWPTEAEQVYYLKLSGTDPDVTLRMANLVAHEGTVVAVWGTDGDDHFEFDASAGRRIAINGIAYEFTAAEVAAVAFDGGSGDDLATLVGSFGDETVTLETTLGGTAGAMMGPGFCVHYTSVANVEATGGPGGYDVANLLDTSGSATFIGRATVSTFSRPGVFSFSLRGFDEVHATATPGSGDVAHLYDSSGDESFVAGPTEASLTGAGFKYVATEFDNVHAYARYGGVDRAELFDGPANDSFIAYPTYATMSGPGFWNRVTGFEEVQGFGTAGGSNGARLYDSSGDDTFEARQAETTMTGPGYRNIAQNFRSVYGYAYRAGHDVAHLYGTPTDDTLVGKPSYAEITGRYYTRLARAFDEVYAHPSDGRDVAYLYDSEGDDTFIGRREESVLSGPGYALHAVGYEVVRGTASLGTDVADLYASSPSDRFTITPPDTRLAGADYTIIARAFDEVHTHPASKVKAGIAQAGILDAALESWRSVGLSSRWPPLWSGFSDRELIDRLHQLGAIEAF